MSQPTVYIVPNNYVYVQPFDVQDLLFYLQIISLHNQNMCPWLCACAYVKCMATLLNTI